MIVVISGAGSVTYLEDGRPITLQSSGGGALVEKMNALGSQGWEMTGVVPIQSISNVTGGTSSTTIGYWFKRPKP